MHEYRFEYEISFQDLRCMLAARERIRFRKTKMIAFVLVLALQIALLVGGLYLIYVGKSGGLKIALVALAFLAGLFAIKYILTPLVYQFYYRRLKLRGVKIETSFNPEGLKSSGNGIVSEISWDGFLFASQTKDHFFLWVNVFQAVIFPLRVVADHQQRDAIWSLIEANIETRKL